MTDDDRDDGGDAGRWERFGRSYRSFAEMDADPRYRADMARELAAHRRGSTMFGQPMDKWDRPEHWRRAVAELEAYATRRAGLSKETARDLASALRSALDGHPPASWRGSTDRDPLTAEAMTPRGVRFPPEFHALGYVELANRRLVIDRAPVQTVLRLFGVSRNTYYNWRKYYAGELATFMDHVQPAQGDTIGLMDRTEREALVLFAERYRAERGLRPLTPEVIDPPKSRP